MTTKTNDRLTKKYVDEAVDANRQYAETLFGKAEGRVKLVIDSMIDQKLNTALSVIRPENTVKSQNAPLVSEIKHISLRQANEDLLVLLRQQLQKLASLYYQHSGLKLESSSFIWNGAGAPEVNFTVTNPPTC